MPQDDKPHPLRRSNDYIPEVCKVTHDEVDRRVADLEEAVELLRTRPPVWATTVMMFLAAGDGALVTHLLSK